MGTSSRAPLIVWRNGADQPESTEGVVW